MKRYLLAAVLALGAPSGQALDVCLSDPLAVGSLTFFDVITPSTPSWIDGPEISNYFDRHSFGVTGGSGVGRVQELCLDNRVYIGASEVGLLQMGILGHAYRTSIDLPVLIEMNVRSCVCTLSAILPIE